MEKDVRGLGEVLRDPELGGFEVSSLMDEPLQVVLAAIGRVCQARQAEDLLLLYCSGMGLLDKQGRLHLMAHDSDPEVPAATGISSRFLLEQLDASPAKDRVLILDCSYSGAALRGVVAPDEVVILTSSGPLHQAMDTSAGGAFTSALTEGIKTGRADLDGDGKINFDELYHFARAQVEKEASEQRPRLFNLAENPPLAARVASHVFVSYNRADADFARWLVDHLQSVGHRTWMDDRVPGGEDWREETASAINKAKAVVCALSPDSLKSTWVRRELQFADKGGIPILPVVHQAAQLPQWYELQFGNLQRVDLASAGDKRQTLLDAVQKRLARAAKSDLQGD